MMAGRFDADKVWLELLREEDPFTLFMAVPTVYNNLAKHLTDGKLAVPPSQVKEMLLKYRLMVSGSAALPETQMDEWR